MSDLHTPIYVKTEGEADWPDAGESMFYVLTGSGLFIGRNVRVGRGAFRSLVPAPRPIGELAEQRPKLHLAYPKIPAAQVARIVGFCGRVADTTGAEAIVLIGLDEQRGVVDLIVPRQVGTVGHYWGGGTYPVDLQYHLEPERARRWRIIGDVHSHAYHSAYASATDKHDEVHAPGLHVVVGHLDREPPMFHADFVVDGHRFHLDPADVLDLDGYGRRDERVPTAWLDQVTTRRIGQPWTDADLQGREVMLGSYSMNGAG